MRSEPVQEILGSIPPWTIRWGITLIFIIIAVILVGSWFFKYPDSIYAEIEIVTQNPPADVISRADGNIEALFVSDQEEVSKGQYLAVIENPANHKLMFTLKKTLTKLKPYMEDLNTDVLPVFKNTQYSEYGRVQPYYSMFLKNYMDYRTFLKVDYYDKKIRALQDQIRDYRIYYEYTYAQRNTLQEDYELAKKDYQRNVKLFNNKAIAEAQLERSKSEMLEKKHDFEEARSKLANTQIKITELEENILDLTLQKEQEASRLYLSLQESYENLLSQIRSWEQEYVIKAPIAGKITFNKYWTENQNITTGEKVLSIVPLDSTNIIGKMFMPLRGAGKVRPGQKVNIKLYNYPYMEFGMISGRVKTISTVPSDNAYAVEVLLSEGLRTNYGIQLDFNQKMRGRAEIITEDIRLLVRVIRPIRSLIQNRSAGDLSPEESWQTHP